MSDPTCRGPRELLGVYVVGAIDPAERAVVDEHLGHCYDCREELAGLAVLPALLHRVSQADAERLLGADAQADDPAGLSPDLLSSLLQRVAARRKSRRLRAAFTVAAVTLAVVGGTAAVTSALSPQVVHGALPDEAQGKAGIVDAMVMYGRSQWGPGTQMFVRVSGLALWSRCRFWVVTKNGHRDWAGAWTVRPGSKQRWYPAVVDLPKSSITEFVLTTAVGQIVKIPVT
jgi:hypothetical protein